MKVWFLLLAFLTIALQSDAQSLNLLDFNKEQPDDYLYTEFTAVVFDGEVLAKPDSPDGPLQIPDKVSGILKVTTVAGSNSENRPLSPVDFKLAIKSFRTNTIRMYSEETFQEVELADVMKKCDFNDQLIFILVDKKYRLPRHEVILMDGC